MEQKIKVYNMSTANPDSAKLLQDSITDMQENVSEGYKVSSVTPLNYNGYTVQLLVVFER